MARLVVIGGGAAGMSAASAARRTDPNLEIVVAEATGYASWGLCGIPYYIAGTVHDHEDLISIRPERFREERRIDLRLHTAATGIDPTDRTVRLRTPDGESTLTYDRLVIAAGASPVVPPLPGVDHERVFVIRAMEEVIRLRRLIDAGQVRRCVVVGAGYIGLEMADALVERDCSVTVVEMLERVMTNLDPSMSSLVEQVVHRHVDLLLSSGLVSMSAGDDGLVCTLGDGRRVDADAVVLAVGVQPTSTIAARAGAEMTTKGALVVDGHMRTTLPGVFAAGDVIAAPHRLLAEPTFVPLAPTANKTGRVAGTVAAGGEARFEGIVGTAVAKVFELTVARTGLTLAEATDAGLEAMATNTRAASRARYYPGTKPTDTRLVYRGDGRLLGAQMVSEDPAAAKRIDVVAAALHGGFGVTDLADLDLSYAPPYAPVYDPLLRVAHAAARDLKSAD